MSTNDHQRRMLRLCAGFSAVSALGVTAPALAQQEGLEEIVVSARFREENLQETPLAITAFTGENLEARNLTDVTMLDTFSPNTIIQPLGAGWGSTAAAFIRGIGLGDNSLSFEPACRSTSTTSITAGRKARFSICSISSASRCCAARKGRCSARTRSAARFGSYRASPRATTRASPRSSAGTYDRLDLRGSYDIALVPDKLFARFSALVEAARRLLRHSRLRMRERPRQLGRRRHRHLAGRNPQTFGIPLPLPPTDRRSICRASSGRRTSARRNGCVVDQLGNENVATGRAAFRWLAGDAVEVNVIRRSRRRWISRGRRTNTRS